MDNKHIRIKKLQSHSQRLPRQKTSNKNSQISQLSTHELFISEHDISYQTAKQTIAAPLCRLPIDFSRTRLAVLKAHVS